MPPIRCIPTLGTNTFVSDPVDMIAYVLKFYAHAPKHATDTFVKETISLIDTLSKYGSDRTAVTGPIKSELTTVFRNLFPEGANVDVTASSPTDPTNQNLGTDDYDLTLSIIVTRDGKQYALTRDVKIVDGKLA